MNKKSSKFRNDSYAFLEQSLKEMPDGALIADLGAGPQHFKKLTKRFKLTAVDNQQFDGIDVLADLNKKLPFPDNRFDAVMLANILEHIYNPQMLISECYRILLPGGKFIATVPFLAKVHQAPYDYLRYTHFELQRLMHEYENVSVHPLSTPYDIFNVITRHFFKRLYKANKRSVPARLLGKSLSWIHISLLVIFRKFYERAPARNEFAYGYGVIAYKKK